MHWAQYDKCLSTGSPRLRWCRFPWRKRRGRAYSLSIYLFWSVIIRISKIEDKWAIASRNMILHPADKVHGYLPVLFYYRISKVKLEPCVQCRENDQRYHSAGSAHSPAHSSPDILLPEHFPLPDNYPCLFTWCRTSPLPPLPSVNLQYKAISRYDSG